MKIKIRIVKNNYKLRIIQIINKLIIIIHLLINKVNFYN